MRGPFCFPSRAPALPLYALLNICLSVSSFAFEALADPTRRRIVAVLRRGERCVNDIVEQVEVQQSGVSRHLRILSEAGFSLLMRFLMKAMDSPESTMSSTTMMSLDATWQLRSFRSVTCPDEILASP